MVLLQDGTIYTSNIFQNVNEDLSQRMCDLLFFYDGHDIYLEKDDIRINHTPEKILEIYVELVIPMLNSFADFANSNFKNSCQKNPYILKNGVVVEWCLIKAGKTLKTNFMCVLDLCSDDIKVGFKVEMQTIDLEDPYFIYISLLSSLETFKKQKKDMNLRDAKILTNLVKKYKKIRKEAKVVNGKFVSTKQALSELLNIKKQVEIVMKDAIESPFNNGKKSKLLDLRNRLFRMREYIDFKDPDIIKLLEEEDSYMSLLIKTTFFNKQFLDRQEYHIRMGV